MATSIGDSGPYTGEVTPGGPPDVRELADYDADALAELFARPPALHRYPKAMAGRVQDLCRGLVEHYDGDVTRLWRDVSQASELFDRLVALPGFGTYKAQIFVALLGKQCNVRPNGWREVAGAFGDEGVYRSVADVTDADSLAKVREHKQQVKAATRAKR